MPTDLPWEVALAAAEHLVWSWRMKPVDQWVEHLVAMRANDENEGIF